MMWNKVYIRVPHPHEIRKSHYRRVVAVMFVMITATHYFVPEHEFWISMATNFLWLFDPTEA